MKSTKPLPVTLAEPNTTLEDKYLNILEYIIKRHIGNKILLIQSLDLPAESKHARYVNDVTEFVNTVIESELFLFNLERKSAVVLWKELRDKPNNNVVNFVLYITSKFRFHVKEEYDTVVKHLINAYTYTVKEGEYDELPKEHAGNIIQLYDKEFKKKFNYERLYDLFTNNPWLVVIALMSMIDPIL